MCQDCSDILKIDFVPGVDGINGVNAYVYIASADNSTGLNFTYPQDPTQNWIGIINSDTVLTPVVSDFSGFWRKVQGVDGTNGTNGIAGGVSFTYRFGSTAFIGNPGAGYLNLDNTVVDAATNISINKSDINGVNVIGAMQALAGVLSSNPSAIPGGIKITKADDSSKYIVYTLTNFSIIGGLFANITVSEVAASNSAPFVQGDEIIVSVIATGDQGDQGDQGDPGNNGTNGTNGTNGSNGTNGLGYKATSVSNRTTAASGSFTFVTVEAANTLAYSVGARVRCTITTGSVGDYMEGVVTSYSGQNLVFTADLTSTVGASGTAWNINLAGDQGTPGSSAGMSNTVLSITTGQVLTLFSIPIQILAAPGAGKGYDLVDASATLAYNTTAYAGNTNIQIIGASSGIVYANLNSTILTETSSTIYKFDMKGTTSFKVGVNEALQVIQTTSNPTTGNSPMKFYLTYKIITI